ncbi:MAG: DUF5812 family protein [Halorientalis sp.]
MKHGTFLVTHADEESAVVQDVTDSQVHTLADNPGLHEGEVLEATLEPEPPMEVAWQVTALDEQRTIPVEHSQEPPTQQARELAADQQIGDLTTQDRAGEGELHVLTVPPNQTADAAEEIVADEETVARAARLDVARVEVRAEDGVVSVRYLP